MDLQVVCDGGDGGQGKVGGQGEGGIPVLLALLYSVMAPPVQDCAIKIVANEKKKQVVTVARCARFKCSSVRTLCRGFSFANRAHVHLAQKTCAMAIRAARVAVARR